MSGMDFFSALPEVCMSNILSLTSPRDVCRSSAISWGFKSAADSDAVWDRFLPSDHREIISRAVSPVGFSTNKQLYFRLADSHILLDDGNQSFALDKESGKKCLMLGARLLTSTWETSPKDWKWIYLPQSRFSEVAKLGACWLEIKGRMGARLLSPKTTYVAYLVFKIVRWNSGFEYLPVKASIRFVGEGDGDEDDEDDASNAVYLIFQPFGDASNGMLPVERKDGWMEVELGEFLIDGGERGEVEMRLMDTESGYWKSGLIVEGIELRPKKVDAVTEDAYT